MSVDDRLEGPLIARVDEPFEEMPVRQPRHRSPLEQSMDLMDRRPERRARHVLPPSL